MLPHQDAPSTGQASTEGIEWTFPLACKTIGLKVRAKTHGASMWESPVFLQAWQRSEEGTRSSRFSPHPNPSIEGVGFARVYAVYVSGATSCTVLGGVFILLSYGWGWIVDGSRPDLGDAVGCIVAVLGVALAWFWPRPENNSENSA
eukprot:scaffold302846_cov23-Tisochrysis_lutea.AAC.2